MYAKERYANDPKHRSAKLKSQIAQRKKRLENDPEFRKKLYIKQVDYQKEKYKTKNSRYHTDPMYRLSHNISSQIRQSLSQGKQGEAWEKIVGFTLNQLVHHLESLFEDGMTWENYGEWQIDHRKPRSWFKFETIDDPAFRECWLLSNLQPKWAGENIAKGNRFAD